MCRVVERYLDGPCDSPSHQLRQLLANDDPTDSEHITAVTQLWCKIFDNEETWLTTSVCVTCFAILWLAIKGEGVSSMVATTLDAAAGLAQRQKWGLILPSSARVSLLTYQTVLGVRYPELVKATADGWKYGRYVSTEATLQGGFLPVFWDVPKSNMHAVSDLGALVEWLQANIAFGHDSANNLAVLHNQNRMVDDFGLSAWVTQSKGQVISRSVTSCAGMTAFMVVVAQTKVGFLTGGRGQKFRALPEEERAYTGRRGICSCNSCPHSCLQNVCHFLPLRHEGFDWCCDRYGQPHVRCRSLLAWHNQYALAWILA